MAWLLGRYSKTDDLGFLSIVLIRIRQTIVGISELMYAEESNNCPATHEKIQRKQHVSLEETHD